MDAILSDTSDREISTTRTVDAQRNLAWKAWTDLKHLEQWRGPEGLTTTTSYDPRPGGS